MDVNGSEVSLAAGPRFLLLEDVAQELATSRAQVYALVRTGELPAIKIGGRGQWRVERSALEGWIEQCYAQTRSFLTEHPWVPEEAGQDPDADVCDGSLPG